jgi:subtilisin-like proprotein convertase family protein
LLCHLKVVILSIFGHYMILTPLEYSKQFPFNNKKVSAKTVKRRCKKNLLPKNHIPKKLTGGWIIEVLDKVPSNNVGYFNMR